MNFKRFYFVRFSSFLGQKSFFQKIWLSQATPHDNTLMFLLYHKYYIRHYWFVVLCLGISCFHNFWQKSLNNVILTDILLPKINIWFEKLVSCFYQEEPESINTCFWFLNDFLLKQCEGHYANLTQLIQLFK